MSPHALPPSPSSSNQSYESNVAGLKLGTNGVHGSNARTTTSLLEHHSDEETQDLIGVGFGPASLAIAVALHDALESRKPLLRIHTPKVRFLERQRAFAWHAGMLLPGAKMQISFVKDLATLRNPRSQFTFLNYLHQNGRLVQFTNLSTFLPQRIEYEHYMRWCANHFEDVVDYDQDVDVIDVGSTNVHTGAVESFQVTSTNRGTGRQTKRYAKHIVIAAGGRPRMPENLPSKHARIIHSSQYATSVGDLFPAGKTPRSVAVIGGGQSAAEIFHNIPTRFPGAKSHLIIRGAALKPSDDSPFVNEVFDPERVDDIYSQEPTVRAGAIAQDKATNYGVVRLELLEDIYSTMYSQQIQYSDPQDWPQQIHNHCNVTSAEDFETPEGPRLRLNIRNDSGNFQLHKKSPNETMDVDLVIVASGYIRNAHEDMLNGIRHLMPGGGKEVAKRWEVERDYRVRFQEDAVSRDAGIWLQGCNEGTHGLSDTLLSILAIRGGEMVQSIFAEKTGLGCKSI
jgi:L-ornithine N5-oxygenase